MKHKRQDGGPDLFGYVPPNPPIPSFPARPSDPQPSQDSAARKATDDVKRFGARSQQAKMLVEFDKSPCTYDEAAARIVGWNAAPSKFQGCRRRGSDLLRAGYIEDSGERRCNPGSPDESTVWRTTSAGKAAIARLLATGFSQ